MTPTIPTAPIRMSRATTLVATLVAGLLLVMVACDPPETEIRHAPAEETGVTHEFTFEGYMDGYVGVGGDIDGETNPTLQVDAGDEVVLHFINGENMQHDIAVKEHDEATEMLHREGEEASISFIAQQDDEYYCTVPGHEQAGMVGQLKVDHPEADDAPPRAQID